MQPPPLLLLQPPLLVLPLLVVVREQLGMGVLAVQWPVRLRGQMLLHTPSTPTRQALLQLRQLLRVVLAAAVLLLLQPAAAPVPPSPSLPLPPPLP